MSTDTEIVRLDAEVLAMMDLARTETFRPEYRGRHRPKLRPVGEHTTAIIPVASLRVAVPVVERTKALPASRWQALVGRLRGAQ